MMMVKIFAYMLGMCLSVQLTAALFGIIDLKYRFKEASPKIITGIFGWSLLILLIGSAFKESYRPVYFWGIFSFAVFHIACFFIGKWVFARPVPKG